MILNDWTGSYKQRREIVTVAPPPVPRDTRKRFGIKAGTVAMICAVNDSRQKWSKHRTREALEFSRFETYKHKQYTFRHLGYFIRVAAGAVEHRTTA